VEYFFEKYQLFSDSPEIAVEQKFKLLRTKLTNTKRLLQSKGQKACRRVLGLNQ
jgi:hypothetical protein